MFELSVALKYLVPRWRQLSVSIISIISILVIALVVWLIVVFFSVTMGLEQTWIHKLISVTAPVRMTPTEAYYQSYYYQIDSLSSASQYSSKTIGEKLLAAQTDPYNPTIDEETPSHFTRDEGEVKDIVKMTFGTINQITDVPGLTAHDYEITFSNLRLRLLREFPQKGSSISNLQKNQGFLFSSSLPWILGFR